MSVNDSADKIDLDAQDCGDSVTVILQPESSRIIDSARVLMSPFDSLLPGAGVAPIYARKCRSTSAHYSQFVLP